MFIMAQRDPAWYTQYLTRDDTGIPTKEAVEADRRSGMPESLVQQEYYVKWTASTEETLIPLDIIEEAYKTVLREDDYSWQPRIMGVDVAFAINGDAASIAKRQGRFLHPLKKYQGVNNMALATEVAREINDWKADAVFIDAGRGEGVISRLWQLGYEDRVIPVHFSGKSFSDLYLNKRAEIWCRMRDWFIQVNRPLIPRDESLAADLSAPTFYVNDRGFIQIETKKEIKKRLKRSPDEGDAVALTFSEDVQVPEYISPEESFIRRHMIHEDMAEGDYDVLNHFNSDKYDSAILSASNS
jgi:hypothetical protein